jgi:hypothetical protein
MRGKFTPESARIVALLAAVVTMVCVFTAAAEQGGNGSPRHPNILLIIGDDFGMDATSDMYPGLIDGFARQGMRILNTWAEPFCSPTRSPLITSRSCRS